LLRFARFPIPNSFIIPENQSGAHNNLLCNIEANAAFSVEVYDFPIHPSSLSTQF